MIWKFDGGFPPVSNPPENVLMLDWLPQTDILAHSNVVLFIAHGDRISNEEAIKYGVPLLVIPFYGDQHRNAYHIERVGYGKILHFNEITHESLYNILAEMLTSPKYSTRAKEFSAIFGENPVHPMDEFIFWIEYVIKFRGAKHLKSHAANMLLFTYLLLDVILVSLAIISTIIFCVIKWKCSKKNTVEPNQTKEKVT